MSNKRQYALKLKRYTTKELYTYIFGAVQTIRRWWFVCLFLVGVSLSLLITACSSSNIDNSGNASATSQRDINLTFVSYSVTNAAYEKIIPKFIEKWKKEHNQNITFKQSYDGSGSQTINVIEGLEADVVHLSLALDINKLVQAGLIQQGWEKEAPNDAIVTHSVGAIATRQGNPKNIKNWTDLTQNGLNVLTANPKTSGGARWNFLCLWAAVTKTGGNENQALDFISKVYKNVPVLPKTARNATDLFFQENQGDVLLNYENEMILAAQNGAKFSYVIPDVNVSIDNPVAVVDKNVDKHGTRAVAEAFIKFLYTPDVQREFVNIGFRTVDTTILKDAKSNFPKIKTLLKAQDLGGWDTIQKKFFDEGAIFDKIQVKKA